MGKNWLSRVQKAWHVLSQQQTTVMTAAVIIMISYGLSMLLGLLRERLLAGYFYQCCLADLEVYYAAFRLPDMIFQLLVSGSLSAAFIPVFSQLLKHDVKKAKQVANTMLSSLGVGFLVLSVPLFIWAPEFSKLITGNFSDSQVRLMVELTRMMIAAQGMFIISSLLTGILQSHHRFLLPALAPVVYNLGIILGITMLGKTWGIYGPVVGIIAGAFLHTALQVPLVWKLGFKYSWAWDWKLPQVREIGKLMIPRVAASGINQLEMTGAVWFATSMAPGSLVLFSLAQTLMQVPVKLVGTPISQAALPSLAQATGKDGKEFGKILGDNLLQILYFVLPATAMLVILGLPAVRLTYGSATFPWEATKLTRQALAFFILAIPCQAVIQLLTRGFYAQKDTRTPLMIGLVSVVAFLGMAAWLTFSLRLGILGLAAATSIASFAQAGLLLWQLHRKTTLVTQELMMPTNKLLLATLVTAVAVFVPYRWLDNYILNTTRVLPLVGLTVTVLSIGLAVYITVCHWLNVDQQGNFLKLLYQLPGTKKTVEKLRTLTAVAAEG